eukprot:4231006-Prymnesium_polylepis.1
MPYPRVGFALEGRSRAKHVTNTEKKHKREVTRYHTLAHARAAVVAAHARCIVCRIVQVNKCMHAGEGVVSDQSHAWCEVLSVVRMLRRVLCGHGVVDVGRAVG